MKIIFYQKEEKKSPILDFLKELEPKDRLRILTCLKSVEELGVDSTRVQFRQIKGKLWEIKIRLSSGSYRLFYVMICSDQLVLLHGYKKQSRKAPIKEIQLAEKRMKEVLNNET